MPNTPILQQGDELFLPASSHPSRASFFDCPSSPTYLYDDGTETFRTIWPDPSNRPPPQAPEVTVEPEWEDVQPPSPLRTPPRNEDRSYPPPTTQRHLCQQEAYFVEDQSYFDEPYPSELDHENLPSPELVDIQRIPDHEIRQAMSPPNPNQFSRFDGSLNNYHSSNPRPEVDADGVSISEFSFSARDDRRQLPSERELVSPPRFDTEKARMWATPRVEAPIPLHPQTSTPVYQQAEQLPPPQHHTRVFSDPGTAAGSPWKRYAPSAHQPSEERPAQQRQRLFSDPGTVTVSHWERRRDIMLGRNSLPPGGAFDDSSEPVSSSFRVLNVQRVPVGSLELQLDKGRSKEDSKKLNVWRKLKGFVS